MLRRHAVSFVQTLVLPLASSDPFGVLGFVSVVPLDFGLVIDFEG